MNPLIILGIANVAFIIIALIFINRLREKMNMMDAKSNDQLLNAMNNNLQGVQERLDNTNRSLNERLDNAARIIGQVNKELGSIQSIGQGIKAYQEFLAAPKMRGNLGEQVLNDSLKQHFPAEMFTVQYKFRDGNAVDAIIRTSEGILPVDSKFPMDAFRRMKDPDLNQNKDENLREFLKSVKKHIDDIAKKYIQPQEGTLDFAVMYVPSEHVYYDIVTASEELMNHAYDRRVLLVSPNSLGHFLRVILMGMEKTKLQESAKKIWTLLKGVQQDSAKFGEQLGVTSRHVTNAKNAIDDLNSQYQRLNNQLDQIKLIE